VWLFCDVLRPEYQNFDRSIRKILHSEKSGSLRFFIARFFKEQQDAMASSSKWLVAGAALVAVFLPGADAFSVCAQSARESSSRLSWMHFAPV